MNGTLFEIGRTEWGSNKHFILVDGYSDRYLHGDGEIRVGIGEKGNYSGFFNTWQEAEAAIELYNQKHTEGNQ